MTTVTKDERAQVLLEFADTLHPIEQPTSTDAELWDAWNSATRVREHVASMYEN